MGSSTPDAPQPTPEQKAMERRTMLGLEQERAKTERRLKAQARSKLGVQSLLKGIAPDAGPKQEDVVHSTDKSLKEKMEELKIIKNKKKRKKAEKFLLRKIFRI